MKDAYKKRRLKIPIGKRFKKGNKPIKSLLNNEDVLFIKQELKVRTITIKQLSINLRIPYYVLKDINCGKTYNN